MRENAKITISLGEQGQSLAARYPNQVKTNKQPAGIDFYKFKWPTSEPGSLVFENKNSAVKIEHALGVIGSQNVDFSDEGINEFNITAGLTTTEKIPHEQARKEFYAILNRIRQAGWIPYTLRNSPRLPAKETFEYQLNTGKVVYLNSDYMPDLNDWMKIKDNTEWAFYTNHAYLNVSFMRDSSLMDKDKDGAYLLLFDFKSENSDFRREIKSEDKKKWRDLLHSALLVAAKRREEKESELKKQGIKIDEDYIDPPLPIL